jgi:PadR family transcriptional regulator PadR
LVSLTVTFPEADLWFLSFGSRLVSRRHLSSDFQQAIDNLHPREFRDHYKNRIELIQGTLDMLILQTLRGGRQHGYGIAQAIRSGSSDILQVETGSLYPALHRLEKEGWVKSEWKQSENNQRAKYYNLTAAGRKQLAVEQTRWKRMSAAIGDLMKPKEA